MESCCAKAGAQHGDAARRAAKDAPALLLPPSRRRRETVDIAPRMALPLLLPPNPAAGSFRQMQESILDLDAFEGVIEQPVELAEFAGVIDVTQRAGHVDGVRRQQPAVPYVGAVVGYVDRFGYVEPALS